VASASSCNDPNSQLNWIERIIRMRKEVPEIGWGKFAVLPSGAPEVLILRYDWRNNAVLTVHNLAPTPLEIRLEVKSGSVAERDLISLLSESHSHANDAGIHHIVLEPYGYRWYRVGGLDYLLKRADI
jgi:maltose alpha-D-glucosyltransferase/alpha-amylase